jgi:hypothetical protein
VYWYYILSDLIVLQSYVVLLVLLHLLYFCFFVLTKWQVGTGMKFLKDSLSKIQKFVFSPFFSYHSFIVVITDRKIVFIPLFVLEASILLVPSILSLIEWCCNDCLSDRTRWTHDMLGITHNSITFFVQSFYQLSVYRFFDFW